MTVRSKKCMALINNNALPWQLGIFFQTLFPSQIIEPVSSEAEYPSEHERLNSVPVALGAVGEMLAEWSILNGPLHMLAKKHQIHACILSDVAKHC